MEELGEEPVFLRCMGTFPRNSALRLGQKFEEICRECRVRAVMFDENFFHISGSLQGLVQFHDQVAASCGKPSSQPLNRTAKPQRRLPASNESGRESKPRQTVERVTFDIDKLSAVVRKQPDLLLDCSQNGATVYFPALCVEGQPRQRAEAVARLREEVARCTSRPADTASLRSASSGRALGDFQPRDVEPVQSFVPAHPNTSQTSACSFEMESSVSSFESSTSTRTWGNALETEPVEAAAAGDNGSITLMRWCSVNADLTLEVRFGDIVNEHVDAIVNPANERLRHLGGVAAAIVRAGGDMIIHESNEHVRQCGELSVTEVVPTSGGQLPCQHVLHTVGPRWGQGGGESEFFALRHAVNNALRMAQELRCQSVAIPAISAGIFGMPLPQCARCLFAGVDHFSQRNKNSCVNTVYLTNNNEETCVAFCSEFSRLHGSVSGRNGVEFVDLSVQRALASGSSILNLDQRAASSQMSVVAARPSTDSSSAPHTSKPDNDSVCPVCLGEVDDPIRLSKCQHVFCHQCWQSAKKVRPICPVCKTSYGEVTGNQPPGIMTVSKSPRSLPGYEGCGTIQITYVFDSGRQGPEHPNPGHVYHGTLRQAYLPDNAEGQQVLALLRRAFDARLTFTVGTSTTSGQSNTVVWNDIHHKTNVSGGPTNYGYPDLTYLARVKEELSAKGIV